MFFFGRASLDQLIMAHSGKGILIDHVDSFLAIAPVRINGLTFSMNQEPAHNEWALHQIGGDYM